MREEVVFGQALVDDCRRAVQQSSRSNAFKQHCREAARRTLELLGGITVSLAGVTLGIHPAAQRIRSVLLDEQLSTALERASETAVAAGRPGVLFCWDEAHILRDSARQRQFPLGLVLAAMARAQREGQPLMLVVGGLPSLTENLSRAKSYTERMFQAEALGVLQPPEDLLAFSRPLELAGREYDLELPLLVRQDSGGYPFQVQFAGALLWDAVEWPERITAAAYQRHRAAILDAFDRAFFEARLARTSRAERAILQAVAASGEAATVQDVLRLARMPNQNAQQLIARLRDKGLVYRPERGQLAFTLPLLGDYLRRRGPSK